MMRFEYEPEEVDAIFQYVDRDKDSRISYSEFKQAITEFKDLEDEAQKEEENNNNSDPREDLTRNIFQRINEVLKNENIDRLQAFKSIDLDRDNLVGV